MTGLELLHLRLRNQRLTGSNFYNPIQLVNWMGAMQAQDFSMAKLAIGIRLQNCTEENVDDAYNRGEIIRTHVMRPTWHFVAAEDIYWMLNLSAPRIKSILRSRHTNLELSKDVVNKSLDRIAKTVSGHQFSSRENLAFELLQDNIRTDQNRLSHILLLAELEGLVCSGPLRNNKITYALLEERVPIKKVLTREESLAELTKKYFRSHSPSSPKDYSWWSGLTLKEVRAGVESIKNDLVQETINAETYWIWNHNPENSLKSSLILLPAYDEFLIGYQNRSAVLHKIDQRKIVSENGIFRPVILLNGEVLGLWRKQTQKNVLTAELNYFLEINSTIEKRCSEALDRMREFYKQEIQLVIKKGISLEK